MHRSHPFVFVTGGCRSGKSAYAQSLTERFAEQRLYLATAVPADQEMRERVKAHQEARGRGWRTHEVLLGQGPSLPEDLPAICRPGEAVLLDCLTLWASGCMDGERIPDGFADLCEALFAALWALPCPVVVVSNEVGMGLVPPSAAGRAFRDMVGLAGQKAAARATTAVLVVSGIPLPLKGDLAVLPCPAGGCG